MAQALTVTCGVAGFEYSPAIQETEKTHILFGNLIDKDGKIFHVGRFEIPKEVTHVELRADPEGYYLVEILPVRGWLEAINGLPSPVIRVLK